jgi:hypothetical protein
MVVGPAMLAAAAVLVWLAWSTRSVSAAKLGAVTAP